MEGNERCLRACYVLLLMAYMCAMFLMTYMFWMYACQVMCLMP
jgi:hypothetical protein